MPKPITVTLHLALPGSAVSSIPDLLIDLAQSMRQAPPQYGKTKHTDARFGEHHANAVIIVSDA